MWQSHLISHSIPVPVSCSLQVSLLASQPTESAARGEPCGEPAISHDSHHVSPVQWTNLFASHHKGHRLKSPGGYLCETGILLLALSCYKYEYKYKYKCKYIYCIHTHTHPHPRTPTHTHWQTQKPELTENGKVKLPFVRLGLMPTNPLCYCSVL